MNALLCTELLDTMIIWLQCSYTLNTQKNHELQNHRTSSSHQPQGSTSSECPTVVNHVPSLSISSNHGTFSILQESLAVRVWRPSPIEKIYDESTQGTVLKSRPTFSELLLCRYLYSFSYCCLPNLRNPARFSKNSNLYSSRSPKVIDLGVNWKGICNFLLVINSNFGRISYSLGLYAICCRALKS